MYTIDSSQEAILENKTKCKEKSFRAFCFLKIYFNITQNCVHHDSDPVPGTIKIIKITSQSWIYWVWAHNSAVSHVSLPKKLHKLLNSSISFGVKK